MTLEGNRSLSSSSEAVLDKHISEKAQKEVTACIGATANAPKSLFIKRS